MEKIKKLFYYAEKFLIVQPTNLSVDFAAAALAWKKFLKQQQKKEIKISSIPFIDQEYLEPKTLIIGLGIQSFPDHWQNYPHIKINRQIGLKKYNSISEATFHFFNSFGFTPNANISTILLIGLIDENNLFRSPQTNSETIKTTIRLIENGGNYQAAIKSLYRSLSFNQLQLWGQILQKAKFWDNQTISVFLEPEDFLSTQTNENDLEFLRARINLYFHRAKNIFLFWQTSANKINLWLKSPTKTKEEIKKEFPQLNLTFGLKNNTIKKIIGC